MLFLLFVALRFPHCFLFFFFFCFFVFFVCFFFVCFFFSICVMMIELWSQSSIAAHFAFCFSSCVVVLAFGYLQQLPILLSVLLVVIKSGIGIQGEVGWP